MKMEVVEAPPRAMPQSINPMLATLVSKPFSSPEWLFEPKWDGVRGVCFISEGLTRIVSRNHLDMTTQYPELAGIADIVNAQTAILDGEIVALDEKGIPRFQLLQRFRSGRHGGSTSVKGQLAYYIFDLLYLNGRDLMGCDILRRKSLLQSILGPSRMVRYSDHVIENGEGLFEKAEELGLEGVVAKRIGSPYVQKRSRDWLKLKTYKRTEAVVAGYTRPRGARQFFGALVLGLYRDSQLVYVAHTGGGFNEKSLKDIYRRMQLLKIDHSPFANKLKTNEPVQWIDPVLVCEVKFSEWTEDAHMRHPIFLGMRNDKKPEECVFEPIVETGEIVSDKPARAPKLRLSKASKTAKTSGSDTATPAMESRQPKDAPGIRSKGPRVAVSNSLLESSESLQGNMTAKIGQHAVNLTNMEKIYWPNDGYTKGDLIRYYFQVAEFILPHLKNRPLILKRYPGGIKKPAFHQHTLKDAPSYVARFERDGKEGGFHAVANNAAALLYVVNLGTITQHAWMSRCNSPDRPDWIVFDLDPGKATFGQVCEVALLVRKVLAETKLACYPKTSGGSGMHVYLPLKGGYSYQQVVQFASAVAGKVVALSSDLVTTERSLSKRKPGQVYLDVMQNARGKSVAGAYSVRARQGAPVSTPLDWNEVARKKVVPGDFTIKNVLRRLESRGDLFREVLEEKQALPRSG